jgi:hypothetical protein
MKLITDTTFPNLQYITAENIHSPQVSAVFSTRNGGENYKTLISCQGFEFENLVTLEQKHTANIVVVDEDAIGNRRRLDCINLNEAADALITNIKGLLLSVRTADCVPILLYDPYTKSVGAVHAGWRGTLAKIGPKTVKRMAGVYGTNPKDIKAAIGPAIGPCCFEVGFEVRDSFLTEHGTGIAEFFSIKLNNKPYCDIKSINKAFLTEAGIPDKNIEVSDFCTKCSPDLFYSYRYSGGRHGLMANFIGLK